jgi:diguanylate cyclase (GGDEF)-like protein
MLQLCLAAWVTARRQADLLARYGGEEFAVVLPDCSTEQAVKLADRLRSVMPEGTNMLRCRGDLGQ